MNIKFNISFMTYNSFHELKHQSFERYFINYNVFYLSDINKYVFKRKLHLSSKSGSDIRYDINPIKYFEIKRKNNKIQFTININHFLFTIVLYSVVFLAFFYVFKFSVYFLVFLLFVAYFMTILIFLKQLNHIIDITYKMFESEN